ncbi:TIGR02444 family protein [Pseudoteredinibacter isoporae]|uniref:Uncharacterized protein (TIGR02444 family) n=1 Tax=Pseudoteredinibacter isoporae TaxID=570281 RepID=A0A7X0MX27_9GAMM|nr:TIGR02444 family protein [Pseudoteredinibacter isoporae]MBB6520442.1 uncharacterized protein (TIGR02444 family) [Pseudoteredinibacter isoporae]NHO86009.1 TIGR02444 family protein [Pseudoteredinibacter isoporae]NIB25540.1 TIGR02444 family protein [Pseudoteredinibacter isoporae]
MTEHNENLFWQFSLGFYGEAGVADALLELQDQHGCQVNMLLWCLWLGKQQHRLSTEVLSEALLLLDEHQVEYLLPMRDLRRQLKNHPELELYQQAKALELAMERWEQDRLYEMFLEWETCPSDVGPSVAEANIHLYVGRLPPCGATSSESKAKLEALIKKLLEQLFRG